jgi:RNA polymerase sigma-70 factor (ECF subfamily)
MDTNPSPALALPMSRMAAGMAERRVGWSSRAGCSWHTLASREIECGPRSALPDKGRWMEVEDMPGRDADAALATALLSRVAARDEQAFEALYRLTSSRLLGIGMRVLGDRAEAEDVLQEVYVTVWTKAMQFDAQRASAWTWLGTIARNRAIDRLRSLPSAMQRAPMELSETVPDPAPSPASQADTRSEHGRLDECLARLGQRGQALIRTAFFEGVTYDELAARTGSPLGSVKSWIRRGLLQLRECLDR